MYNVIWNVCLKYYVFLYVVMDRECFIVSSLINKFENLRERLFKDFFKGDGCFYFVFICRLFLL